jgi:membrane-associated phospholipid phosphatase
MRNIISIILVLLISAVRFPATAETTAQRGVDRSTDVIAFALPASALVGTLCAQDWKGLVQGVEAAGVTAAVTLAMKYGIKEWRPNMSDTHSFPSAHSAVSFATAAYLQRRYGWAYGGPAYALSCYVAWGRVFARQHHVWDVVAGAAIGAASSYLFTTPFARKHDLQIAPTTDGTSIGAYASFTF